MGNFSELNRKVQTRRCSGLHFFLWKGCYLTHINPFPDLCGFVEDDRAFGEGDFFSFDELVGFVTFAGEQKDIAFLCEADGETDGFFTVGDGGIQRRGCKRMRTDANA